ncbi:hypothetical protein M407DRAFT_226009 [Tulasnella calospora MUT 4182]|uniref:Uncharacterized protein n=1 Tax=Tulasnella calospora MUT 4182 TaxID=1051891 RepID=A0A0C3QF18_9AGAM|nr:hypothetical protein M407DRAFT_226009 [Tulasnella calospora MUT 4182]
MIADVLKAQPSITELEIQGVGPFDSLPRLDPTDLPNLRVLTASTASTLLLVLRGGHRPLRSLTLGDDISMKQAQDIVFDLIPNGAAVDEFTWNDRPTSKRLSYPTQDHWSGALAFLSAVSVKFPNVRKVQLPMGQGLWKRKEEDSVEWVVQISESGGEEDEEDRGMFERDLHPLGVIHRCYP